MKKQLLALSLITTGLIADNRSNTMTSQQSGACTTCCCTPCCCKPCCVPKPKKCIDCECYNPMFYDLQCDCGFFASVDFLYWYARETNLSYALDVFGCAKDAGSSTSDVIFSAKSFKNLDTAWDPGFRVGIGWNDGCDGWDYYLNWTYIHNSEKSSISVPNTYALNGVSIFLPDVNEYALINQWVNPGVFPTPGTSPDNLQPVTFDSIKAKWEMNLNWVDLELGRKYWTSACFNIRPYVGIRGLWNRVSFRTKGSRTSPLAADVASAPLVFKDRFKTRMWGVGMTGGFQPAWYFCQNFVLFGNMDISLLWGEFEVKKKENYQDINAISGETVNWDTSNAGHNSFFQMTPMLDVALGLRWEDTWCCDQYRSAFDVAWEHHTLFDQNHRFKLVDFFASEGGSTIRQGSGFRTFDEATGNLDLGGLVIRLRVDF